MPGASVDAGAGTTPLQFPIPLNPDTLRASDEELSYLHTFGDGHGGDSSMSLFPYSNFGGKARAYHGLQITNQGDLEGALASLNCRRLEYGQSGAFPSHLYWPEDGSLGPHDAKTPLAHNSAAFPDYPARVHSTALDIPLPEPSSTDAPVLAKYEELYRQIENSSQLPIFPELWARKFMEEREGTTSSSGEEDKQDDGHGGGVKEEKEEEEEEEDGHISNERPRSAVDKCLHPKRPVAAKKKRERQRPRTAVGWPSSSSSSSSSSSASRSTTGPLSTSEGMPLLPRHISDALPDGAQKILRAHEKFAKHFNAVDEVREGPILHPEEGEWDYENWANDVTADTAKMSRALDGMRVQVTPFDGHGATYRVRGGDYKAELDRRLRENNRNGCGAAYTVTQNLTKDRSTVGMGGYAPRFVQQMREPWQIALGPGSYDQHLQLARQNKRDGHRRARAFMMDPKKDQTSVKADCSLQAKMMKANPMHVYEPTVGSYTPSYGLQDLAVSTPCLKSGGQGHATTVAASGLQKWVDSIVNNRVPGPGAFHIPSQLDAEVRRVQYGEQVEKYMLFPRAERKLIETPPVDKRDFILKQPSSSSIHESKISTRWSSPNLELRVPDRIKNLNGEMEGVKADISKQSAFGKDKSIHHIFSRSNRFQPLKRVFGMKSGSELEREQQRRSQFVLNVSMASRKQHAAARRLKTEQEKMNAPASRASGSSSSRGRSQEKKKKKKKVMSVSSVPPDRRPRKPPTTARKAVLSLARSTSSRHSAVS